MASTTSNLGLTRWDLGTDYFSPSALAENWTKIDAHDHTDGKGARIPTEGLLDGAVTAPKLGPGSVVAAKVGSGAIEPSKLKGAPVLEAGQAPVWDGANFIGSSAVDIPAGLMGAPSMVVRLGVADNSHGRVSVATASSLQIEGGYGVVALGSLPDGNPPGSGPRRSVVIPQQVVPVTGGVSSPNKRIDLIVAVVPAGAEQGATATIQTVAGTAATSPTKPPPPTRSIPLAYITVSASGIDDVEDARMMALPGTVRTYAGSSTGPGAPTLPGYDGDQAYNLNNGDYWSRVGGSWKFDRATAQAEGATGAAVGSGSLILTPVGELSLIGPAAIFNRVTTEGVANGGVTIVRPGVYEIDGSLHGVTVQPEYMQLRLYDGSGTLIRILQEWGGTTTRAIHAKVRTTADNQRIAVATSGPTGTWTLGELHIKRTGA